MIRQHFQTAFALLALAAFTTACGEVADVETEVGDSRDDSFMVADAKADVPNTIHENSPEARAILRVVNRLSRHQLVSDADVYWRTAAHISDYREGEDGRIHTEDDRIIFTLAELDSIPFVGKTAFRRLRQYVNENDLIVFDDVVISETVPDSINTKEHTIVRGEIARESQVRITLKGELGDRILLQLRKADANKWNPRLAILDAESGEEVISANPWGTSDARIPVKNEDISRGWEVERDGVDYTIVLHNTNQVDGVYEFSMECVGGPCFANEGPTIQNKPLEELEGDALRQQIVVNHQQDHLRFSYYDARMEMFSSLDNSRGKVECAYTGKKVTTDTIPSNSVMNAEHTWPQSKGAFDGAARSDLHHIYPVDSMVNSLRGATPYCDVVEVIREMNGTFLGVNENGVRCFEPREEHKGNAARAMFYFATVYQQNIDEDQERILRRWHELDPVDGAERLRAERIQVFQGSSQPFVSMPELVDAIADF